MKMRMLLPEVHDCWLTTSCRTEEKSADNCEFVAAPAAHVSVTVQETTDDVRCRSERLFADDVMAAELAVFSAVILKVTVPDTVAYDVNCIVAEMMKELTGMATFV